MRKSVCKTAVLQTFRGNYHHCMSDCSTHLSSISMYGKERHNTLNCSGLCHKHRPEKQGDVKEKLGRQVGICQINCKNTKDRYVSCVAYSYLLDAQGTSQWD